MNNTSVLSFVVWMLFAVSFPFAKSDHTRTRRQLGGYRFPGPRFSSDEYLADGPSSLNPSYTRTLVKRQPQYDAEDAYYVSNPSPSPRSSSSPSSAYRSPSSASPAAYQTQPASYTPTYPSRRKPDSYSPASSSSERASLKDQEEQPEEEKQPSKLELLLAQSKFSCGEKKDGYYADTSVGCQVFHYCVQGAKHSWMCPEQTVFHQVHLNCVPAAQDICAQSEKFFVVNDYLHKEIDERGPNNTIRYHQRFYPEEFLHDAALNSPSSFGYGAEAAAPVSAAVVSRPSRPTVYTRPSPQPNYGNDDDDSPSYASPNQVYRQPSSNPAAGSSSGSSYTPSSGSPSSYSSQQSGSSYRPSSTASRSSSSQSYPTSGYPSSSGSGYNTYASPSGYPSSQAAPRVSSTRASSYSPSSGLPSQGLRYSQSSPAQYSAPSRPGSLAAATAPYSGSSSASSSASSSTSYSPSYSSSSASSAGYPPSNYSPSYSSYSGSSGLSSSPSQNNPSSFTLTKPTSSATPSTSQYTPSSYSSGSPSSYSAASTTGYRRPVASAAPSTTASGYNSRYPTYHRVSSPSASQSYPSASSSVASSLNDNYAPLISPYGSSSGQSPSLSSRFSSAIEEESVYPSSSSLKSGVTYESDY